MAKQVYDILPQAGISRGQSNETLRNYKTLDASKKKWGHFDVTRSNLNFEVRKGGIISPIQQQESIPVRFGKFLKKRNIVDPNEQKRKKGLKPNVRTVVSIILGGSRDRMLDLAFGSQKVDLREGADNSHLQRKEDIEKWAVDMYNLVSKQYGEENILSFVVHLDERNPHVHCSIVPMNEEKNKISFTHVFGKSLPETKAKLKEMHNEVAVVNEKWGLERGDDVRLTGAKHRSFGEYCVWLRDECTRLENEVGGLYNQIEVLNKKIKLVNDEIRRETIAHKGLSTMIWNQERVLEELNNEVNTEEYMLQEIQQKNNEVMIAIQKNQKVLKEKKEQLQETDDKLALLKEKYQELLLLKNDMEKQTNEKREELRNLRGEELDRLETDLFSQFGRYLTYLPNIIGEQLDDLKRNMSLDQLDMFDKMMSRTFLKEMTENYEDVIRTAASFYLGNPSQETLSTLHTGALITPTAGSGGGGSGNGWKKKPNEDDDAYKYRCVAMACMVAKRKRSNRIRR